MRNLYNTKNILRTILTGFILTIFLNANAQVKIGTNGNIISPASILELESANQGLLLPRLADTAAINALSPPNGMLIYLTKVPAVGLYVRKVNGWEFLTGSLGGNGNFNSLTVANSVTAGSFSGPLTGNATSATLAATATNSINAGVTNDVATTAITYPTFVLSTPGNVPLRTSNANLSFVPNTGILTAKGFNGPLVGNVTGTATLAIDATNSANAGITNDVTTNGLQYPTFVSATTGYLPLKTSNTNLTFNANTGVLSALGFSGPLNGNATTSTNATTTTITDDNATATVTFPTFVTSNTGNFGQRTSSTKLTYVPSTGVLTSPSFVSTIPTGAPPFVVASSSVVANLSATNAVNTAITDDVATATTTYPTFVLGTTGNLPQRTSNSRLTFVPSTGALTAISFISTMAQGTPPFVVASTTPVVNLSASFAPAGTLTGGTLNSTVTASNLQQVGAITSGTWNAGTVRTPQLRGSAAAPVAVAGVAAGVGATVSTTGADLAGQITVVVPVGGGPVGTGVIATVTYTTAFPTASTSYPILYPANAQTAAIVSSKEIYATGTAANFTLSTGNGLLQAGTYIWNYHVIGN